MAFSIKDFNFDTFEAQWEKLSENQKAIVAKQAGSLDPQLAILIVLAGITSYHFSVRSNARKTLKIIQSNITRLLANPFDEDQFLKGMQMSESVCARIYSHIKKEMPQKELNYFFQTLLEFDGKGPYFAFKAVYNNHISVNIMGKIIVTVSESIRLAFVDEYLQTNPGIRLKFGHSFKEILQKLEKRDSVIQFYSALFDQQRDVDPFLNNIDPYLKNSDQIILKEIRSQSPELKIAGLKALSLILTKIPPELLLDILATEEVKKVRITIYNIIENSSIGVYSELFFPVWQILCKSDKKEAFQAFKALVVSGEKSLFTLLEMVQDKYPLLIPLINIEISALSKLSFFIIQDIALNKEKYLKSNLDMNLACVLGMIKKRPERIVKLLKKYENDSNDSIRMDVIAFIEKTKQLLSQEKENIEVEFDQTVLQIKNRSKQSKGLIKTFFLDSSQKKIEELKKKSTMNFEGEIIKDADLSSSTFIAKSLFLSKCIFNNCDFSRAVFSNAFFKNSTFYNVNMQKAKFVNVNFDNAVLINVNAVAAKFENCSFQNISVYNCSFNHAQMQDMSFFNAVISKTSFNQTNLSGASFAYSQISAVSFVTSNTYQTDFSGLRARFCRFPSKENLIIKNDDINYNARKFQLSFNDMPQMDEGIVAEINMLIFSEFIHYGQNKFLKQNQLSLLTAFDIFKIKQADLFQIIPFLLHENILFPGIGDLDPATPKGICNYIPNLEAKEAINQYVSSDHFKVRICKNYTIEGLFTIGSTGSIAQTEDSDIDYWVCINEETLTAKAIKLLKKKLALLEIIAEEQFKTKVTFFVVDIQKAKNNDFGDSTIESSGSAQARLLKEEFYRTMIYVAGKIPLWSVLPTAISINYYNSILNNVASIPVLSRYIDLGDIHAIPTNEYFGASIWQMFKWLKSPFKSVIKMALLEKYINEYGKETLLCNKYKDEWMNSGTHLKLAQNDSYVILLNSLIRYFNSVNDKQSVKLLLTCFFLKLGVENDTQIANTVFGLRKILFEKCIRHWGWPKDIVFEIGSFKTWQYSQIAKLSTTIEKYMNTKYQIVNKAFEGLLRERSTINKDDRIVLERKVFIEFSKQPGKVEKVLLVSRSDRHFHGLHLKFIKGNNFRGSWQLLNKSSKGIHDSEEPLIKISTIEEAGAWLINNSLYNENSIIHLMPNSTFVTFDDIRKLFKATFDFLEPSIKKVISFDQLLKKSRVVCLFISINFYAPKQQRIVTDYTAIYINSWGEMYCKSAGFQPGLVSLEEAKKHILKAIGIKKMPVNTAFYFSKGVAR